MVKRYVVRLEITSLDTHQTFFSNQSEGQPPVVVELGKDEIFPLIEQALIDMRIGDEKQFELTPENAFGHAREQAIMEIPLSEIAKENRQVDEMLEIEFEGEHKLPGIIREIKSNSAVVDLNHPLAGHNVLMKLNIVNIM